MKFILIEIFLTTILDLVVKMKLFSIKKQILITNARGMIFLLFIVKMTLQNHCFTRNIIHSLLLL